MNPRLVNSLFGLIALSGIGIAIYSWMSTKPEVTTTSTPTPLVSPTQSATPKATLAPSSSPTPLPSSTPSLLSEFQGLSVPNRSETLKAGGSLASIATTYDVTVDQLKKVNNLQNPDQVYAGQSITIPDAVTQTDYTILFTTNEARKLKELTKIGKGVKSIYQDPVTATITDCKNLFGIGADTPFSTTLGESGTSATLSTSTDSWYISIGLEKSSDSLWTIKRIIAKNTTKTPTP